MMIFPSYYAFLRAHCTVHILDCNYDFYIQVSSICFRDVNIILLVYKVIPTQQKVETVLHTFIFYKYIFKKTIAHLLRHYIPLLLGHLKIFTVKS